MLEDLDGPDPIWLVHDVFNDLADELAAKGMRLLDAVGIRSSGPELELAAWAAGAAAQEAIRSGRFRSEEHPVRSADQIAAELLERVSGRTALALCGTSAELIEWQDELLAGLTLQERALTAIFNVLSDVALLALMRLAREPWEQS